MIQENITDYNVLTCTLFYPFLTALGVENGKILYSWASIITKRNYRPNFILIASAVDDESVSKPVRDMLFYVYTSTAYYINT